jgi:hypothetical protein
MTSTSARIGSALAGMVAFAITARSGDLLDWTTGAFTVGALVLVAAVLFIPSETPARRLRQLIHAWRVSARDAGPEPVQSPALPPPPLRDSR